MTTSARYSLAASITVICALQTPVSARTVTFEAGRFVNNDQNVFNGLFAGDVIIDTLTLGDTTYRAELEELIEPAAVRVWVDRSGNGSWELITDDALARGDEPVRLALAKDLDSSRIVTALDAVQGLSLSHMLHTDGSAAIRVDFLLTVGILDDRPSDNDVSPEAIVLGSLNGHRARLTAMIGGNVNEPILAPGAEVIKNGAFVRGTTDIEIALDGAAHPHPIRVIGLDNSGDLRVEKGIMTVGYRLEIPPGEPAMFNVIGAALEEQQALGGNVLVMEEPDEAVFGGAMGGGGLDAGGARAVATGFVGSRAGFHGGGGGKGGSLTGGLVGSRPDEWIPDAPDHNDGPSSNVTIPKDKPVSVPAPASLLVIMAGGMVIFGSRRRA